MCTLEIDAFACSIRRDKDVDIFVVLEGVLRPKLLDRSGSRRLINDLLLNLFDLGVRRVIIFDVMNLVLINSVEFGVFNESLRAHSKLLGLPQLFLQSLASPFQ